MDAFHQAASLMTGNKITAFFFLNIITNSAAGREKKKKEATQTLYPCVQHTAEGLLKCSFKRATPIHTLIMADDLKNSIKSREAIG